MIMYTLMYSNIFTHPLRLLPSWVTFTARCLKPMLWIKYSSFKTQMKFHLIVLYRIERR